MSSPALRPLPALALIAGIAGAGALAFAWTGGWLTPHRIAGSAIADALEHNAGRYPGFRRAHAKGICVSGHFTASGAGEAWSRASLFRPGTTPVTGRLSLGGGDPMAGDGRNVFHSMALRFVLPGREEWRMALDHTPIFPVATPAAFVALQIASTPDPKTHKPDPAKMKAYLADHPETAAFAGYMKRAPLPSSFANGTYYSINAFRFTDARGQTHTVRWQMEPETPFAALDKATLDATPANALFDDARRRLTQAPLKWHMIVVIPKPGDPTDNATIAWPSDRRRVDVGTLVLDHVATEAAGGCRDVNFDPLILPKGVAGSSDPLLAARSAAYSASFRRRAAEGPHPDALTIAAAKGAAR